MGKKYVVTLEAEETPTGLIMPSGNEIPMLRTSERNDFKRCPWLWQETWLKGYGTRRVPTWAWFGTAIHAALEVRYPIGIKRGKIGDVLDAFETAVGEETGRIWQDTNAILDEQEVVDAKELGRAMLIGYVDHFGDDTEWEVIHTEQPFQINVPHPTKPGKFIVVYAGTWDALWRNRKTKEFWIVDHKTRKAFPVNWTFYEINDQAGSYLWVAPEVLRHLGVFGKKDRIEGLIFNALKKKMPDNRPRNADGLCTNKPKKEHYQSVLDEAEIPYATRDTIATLNRLVEENSLGPVLGDVSAVQPGDLFHREEIYRSPQERVKQARRVQQEALWMNRIRQGKAEAFKTPTEDCVRCKIYEYCQVDEQNTNEGKEIRDTILMRRDYYADHHRAMTAKGVDLTTKKKEG